MSQYNPVFNLKIKVGHTDLYLMVQTTYLVIYLWDYLIYETASSG